MTPGGLRFNHWTTIGPTRFTEEARAIERKRAKRNRFRPSCDVALLSEPGATCLVRSCATETKQRALR